MTTPEQMRLLQGAQVYDAPGRPLGRVNAVYVDDDTGEALWLRLEPGLFRTQPALAPLRGAQVTPGQVRLAVDRDKIDQAPTAPTVDQPLSGTLVDDLYRHYGFAPPACSDADAMTRSEQRLTVNTARQVTGRVRLRKYVETEYVHVEVPVRRERVRVEQQPADETADQAPPDPTGADQDPPAQQPPAEPARDDETVVTLHEERPVIGKQVVPVEQVHLSKQTVTDTETVHEQIRTEHTEADLPDTSP